MKITYYVDIPNAYRESWSFKPTPYSEPPSNPPEDGKRYRFTIEVDDPAEPDEDLGEVETERVET